MPDLTGLPPWAIMVFLAAAGLGFIVIRSGILDGIKKPPAERANAGEIVALSIDSRSLDRLAGEVAGLSVAVTEQTIVSKQVVEMIRSYIEDKKRERADRDLDDEVRRRVAEEVKAAIEEIEQQPRNRPRPRP